MHSAIKVIGEAAAVYVGGNVAGYILLIALGDSGKYLAAHWSEFARTLVWSAYIGWASKKGRHSSVWTWGEASPVTKAIAAGAVIGVFLGRGSRLQWIAPHIKMVFRPSESIMLSMCVLAPFKEELFWRGFLLRRLEPIVGTWPAIIISAGAFGLVHSNPLSATAMGVFLGWLYSPLGTGKLYIAMLVHALANLTSKAPF